MDESYGIFARVYDELMDDVPYEEWAKFLISVLGEYGIHPAKAQKNPADAKGFQIGQGQGSIRKNQESRMQDELAQNLAIERNTVLDLGCGTGTLTELISGAGFDMIGVDNSEEMLGIAMEKRERSGSGTLYLLQDMREFELYGTVGAVYSVCDSLNYILEDADLVQVFSLVNNYLYPGGIFVFDFNTVHKYENIIGDAVIAENRENCSFIWENWYHKEKRINEYDLTIFIKEGTDRGEKPERAAGRAGHPDMAIEGVPYRCFRETHYQRGYTLPQMKGFLEQAGLSFIRAMDADTHGEVREDSGRIYIIARENGKRIPVEKGYRGLK